MKGLNVRNNITYSKLISYLHQRLNIDSNMFDIHIKCYYELNVLAPLTYMIDDDNLNFFRRQWSH